MGLCLGTEVTEEEKKARIHSAKIDRDLYEYAKREMNVVKILLLGAAESGKSTLVKQMKIIHSNGFTKQELISFKVGKAHTHTHTLDETGSPCLMSLSDNSLSAYSELGVLFQEVESWIRTISLVS